MAIIWCGGEDIDFQNGATPYESVNSIFYRAAYARCVVAGPLTSGNSIAIKSTTFATGEVTSGWLTFQLYTGTGSGYKLLGLGKSGVDSGIFLGTGASGSKAALIKRSAGVDSTLASETGYSITGTLQRVDIQFNYTLGTISVFISGVLVISYSGGFAISGVTGFDQVWSFSQGGSNCLISEVCVTSSEDTRQIVGVLTGVPAALGTTHAWTLSPTGTVADINEVSLSDASVAYTNTNAQDEQTTTTALPAGIFTVLARKIVARATMTPTSSVTHLKLGYDSTTAAAGTSNALTTAWQQYERLDGATNPVTGLAWTVSDINTGFLDLQSVT